ncbi:hypothetical protein SDC9_171309 [bioreactor metagenome]|uniref:Uncharacterized protein n=1 Tax=bioreactor metagenome TaxID=1076179 RepID=A0A645GCQ9_9ZZZZ
MSQFGTHAVLFSAKEFIDKINGFLHEHKIGASYRKVEYCDLIKKYDIFDLVGEDNIFSPFFRKDTKYKIQNEWRTILISDENTLISNNEDHFIMDLGELVSANIIEIPGLSLIISETDKCDSDQVI